MLVSVLDATQVVPGHVLHFSCTLYDDYGSLREILPHSAGNVVFGAKEPAVLDGTQGPAS